MRLVLLSAVLALAAGASAQTSSAPAPPEEAAFFARRGDIALTAGVFGVGGGAISHLGARYWVSDRTAVGADVGEATLDVGGSEADDQRFPSYMTSVHAQSASLWAERHVASPWSAVSLVAGVRVHAGLQSRDVSRYLMYLACDVEPCELAGFGASAREEAVTGGVSALVGYEVRLFRGLTVGVTSEVGLARTSATLTERWADREPARSERAEWHAVTDSRLSVSVYL
ncbi:hypothetical protein [Rubrivirga sp. IMCC45206]|uniref:hypothetical protein n=1 Tax=Rubrivirga sp. IMCC45206 TaxID=3391614 RepID=UPI0039902D0C